MAAHPYGSRLLGFTIALAYFVFLESAPLGGQSLGKRVLKLRVTRLDGRLLSLPATLGRFLVAGIPFFLNGLFIALSPGLVANLIGVALVIAVFSVGLSQVYLYCFNRKTGQSLADLVLGAHVVHRVHEQAESDAGLASYGSDVERVTAPRPVRLWPGHMAVLVVLVILPPLAMGGAALFGVSRLFDAATSGTGVSLDDILRIHREEETLPSVVMAGLTVNKVASSGTAGNGVRVVVQSKLQITDDPDTSEALLRQATGMILDGMPGLPSDATVTVVLTRGFDMGIASGWRSKGYRNTVEKAKAWVAQAQTAS